MLTLAQKYTFILQSPDCTESLDGFLSTGILPNQQSVDSAASFLTTVMVETAKLAGMQIKKSAVPRRSARVHQFSCVHKQPSWHDNDCHTLLSDLKQLSKSVSNFPRDCLAKSILLLFNTILSFNVYPIEWKKDILGPLHKSGDKSDTNNF